MLIALKCVLGAIGLLLFYRCSRWIFTTEKMGREQGLEYFNTTGSNYLKGDIGGTLLFGSSMVPLFLFHDARWMFPIVLLLTCVIITRTFGLIVDGYSKMGLFAIIAEFVMIGLAYYYYSLAV